MIAAAMTPEMDALLYQALDAGLTERAFFRKVKSKKFEKIISPSKQRATLRLWIQKARGQGAIAGQHFVCSTQAGTKSGTFWDVLFFDRD